MPDDPRSTWRPLEPEAERLVMESTMLTTAGLCHELALRMAATGRPLEPAALTQLTSGYFLRLAPTLLLAHGDTITLLVARAFLAAIAELTARGLTTIQEHATAEAARPRIIWPTTNGRGKTA